MYKIDRIQLYDILNCNFYFSFFLISHIFFVYKFSLKFILYFPLLSFDLIVLWRIALFYLFNVSSTHQAMFYFLIFPYIYLWARLLDWCAWVKFDRRSPRAILFLRFCSVDRFPSLLRIVKRMLKSPYFLSKIAFQMFKINICYFICYCKWWE